MGTSALRNQIYLDNQSSGHVFCNPNFVSYIRSAERQLQLKSNVADFKECAESVWFWQEAITNILSFTRVKAEYDISYDSENFIIHCAKSGYADMVFRPHSSGLHVYDEEDMRGHTSYSFVEMVDVNMSMLTKRQVASTNLAHNLQAGLAYPSVDDLR